jgi:hypothetical protein
MSERGKGRRLLALGSVTALFVPLALYFLFLLLWIFPARNGYAVCDPEFQPWCEYDATVRMRWFLGVACAVVAVLSLITAYALPLRVRFWWPWAVAPLVLLPTGIALLGSIFGG